MKWNEMKMKWNEMKWNEMKWYDLIWYDMIWFDMIWYDQRKFRNLTSDYTERCCWRSLNQEMWSRRCDTAEMRHEDLAGRRCVKCCVFPWCGKVTSSCWAGGSTQDVAICTPLRARAIWKNWEPRSTFGSWSRQNLHHACAQERVWSQNRRRIRGRVATSCHGSVTLQWWFHVAVAGLHFEAST